MTESEWQTCTDPQKMLEFLREKASDRKLRLFAAACCRQSLVWRLLTAKGSRRVVEASDQFADGLITGEQLAIASQAAPEGGVTGGGRNPRRLSLYSQATSAALETSRIDGWEAAYETQRMTMNLLGLHTSVMLFDIFGSLPFRPVVINPAWLAWNDGTVQKIAQVIYEERSFDRLPVLADALEEAGCADADILNHCRRPGEHVRGCWVVDLILGKS